MQHETVTPEPAQKIEPEDARQGKRVGRWKMLTVSLAITIVGFLIVAAIFAG